MLKDIKARATRLLGKDEGFTLMELLIVIAIIAVLVAIAIPTFAGQLDSAKDAADRANARALYALAQADWMNTSNHDVTTNYNDWDAGEHKLRVAFDDGSTQSFTFSDRTDSVVVDFDDRVGALVTVEGANDRGAITYPES